MHPLKFWRFGRARASLAAVALCAWQGTPVASAKPPPLRVASFRCDATPPPGEPLLWDVPLTKVEEPLLAKGIVIEDGARRYVLCALDWCLVGNGSELYFRQQLAAGAGTDPARVAFQTVHQHAAPYADDDAHRLLDALPHPLRRLSDGFLHDLGARLAAVAAAAAARLEPFDRVGVGEAKVDRVASTRRLRGPDGKIVVRWSNGATSPELAAAPEGVIDPLLKTVTFARGTNVLVRLHYYATHPQTFCCDGRASADFVGLAREEFEREDHALQVYFTGCAGDVTAGKYNDGTPGPRAELAQRLRAGMRAASAATRWAPARAVTWRTAELVLPLHDGPGFTAAENRARLSDTNQSPGARVDAGAIRLGFAGRREARPLLLSSLQLGKLRILHLPGEPMLEFQFYAQRQRPREFVAVAGYGDAGTGYICTDAAYADGGYEPSASNVGPGSEALLKRAIAKLLGIKP